MFAKGFSFCWRTHQVRNLFADEWMHSESHIIEFDAMNKVYKRKLRSTPFFPHSFCIFLCLIVQRNTIQFHIYCTKWNRVYKRFWLIQKWQTILSVFQASMLFARPYLSMRFWVSLMKCIVLLKYVMFTVYSKINFPWMKPQCTKNKNSVSIVIVSKKTEENKWKNHDQWIIKRDLFTISMKFSWSFYTFKLFILPGYELFRMIFKCPCNYESKIVFLCQQIEKKPFTLARRSKIKIN